jgi:hypothetical protein
MSHYTLEQWKRYVEDDITFEDRDFYESHLSSCESCLQLYMQSLDAAAGSYPVVVDQTAFADSVMEAIRAHSVELPQVQLQPVAHPNPNSERFKRANWLRHPLFHYTVAAAITLVLMNSGVFQSIAERFGTADLFRAETAQEEGLIEQPSVSKKLMEKTIVMLDAIQPKNERGGTR